MPRLEQIVDTTRLQRAADGAVPFERNEFMERLIVLRETKPAAFAGLSRAAQSSLAWYEAAKRRAEMLSE
jgi:hypothetical protein